MLKTYTISFTNIVQSIESGWRRTMRRFVIDSKDLANAITIPNSVTIAKPFIIINMVDDGVIAVTDYSTEGPRLKYFPAYKDIESFRQGLEKSFECTIYLTGDDKINIGKL